MPCDVRAEGEVPGEVAAVVPSDAEPDAGLADMEVGLMGASEVGDGDGDD